MPNSRKIIKVFLGSPGDLKEERKVAKQVADEFNNQFADYFGYQVELIGWEDTVSVFGRPQATINKDLEQCELFIGMIWKHWGTSPDIAGPYSSGFEEEFMISVDRRLQEGRPEISLFFKEVEPDFMRDPGESLKKVIDFKNRIIAEKKILFESFSDIRDFESKIRRCLSSYVIRLKEEDEAEQSQIDQPLAAEEEKPRTEKNRASPLRNPLPLEGIDFLTNLIEQSDEGQSNAFEAHEVARFRLLANIVGVSGNDERSIGAHDANLIFQEREKFSLSRQELEGLLQCGFENIFHENTPCWYWLKKISEKTPNILPIYSIVGATAERKSGALVMMRLINCPLFTNEKISRDDYIKAWLEDDSPNQVKGGALQYLACCGIFCDLEPIKVEYRRGDHQTASLALEAILKICLRDSRESAIRALYELQPASVSREILNVVFSNIASLEDELLLEGVDHACIEVRKVLVVELLRRGLLSDEVIQRLLSDGDATIRFESMKALGRTLSEAEARAILVKSPVNKSRAFGLMGKTDNGDEYLKIYEEEKLWGLSEAELAEVAENSSIFDWTPKFVLAEKTFKKCAASIRKSVDDSYKGEFEREFSAMEQKFGRHSIIDDTRKLEEHIRKSCVRRGLDILIKKGDPQDLGRVRKHLREGFVEYSVDDINFLGRFGEWKDVSLIVEVLERPMLGEYSSLLGFDSSRKYRVAAKAICALGRARPADILELEGKDDLVAHIVYALPDSAFKSIDYSLIKKLFNSKRDAVRKAVALKLVKALSKSKLSEILQSYNSGEEYRYYNVVHWLDFGVSMSKEKTAPAAAAILDGIYS